MEKSSQKQKKMTWTKNILTKSKSLSNLLNPSHKKKEAPIFRREIDESGKEQTFVGRFQLTNKILGTGGNSVVHLGFDTATSEKVAIKCIKTSRAKEKGAPYSGSGLTEETSILKNLIHPLVYKFIEAYRTDQYIYVVLEYVEGKILYDMISLKGYIPEEDSRTIFSFLVNTVSYLHSNGVVHNDIKPENMIVTQHRNSPKLIDFGHSTILVNGMSLNVSPSTLAYNAPELITEKKASPSSDIWSMGITLFAMTTGTLPFHESDEDELKEKILNGEFDFQKSKQTVSHDLQDLIRKMLVTDPSKRASMIEIKNHPWFLKGLSYYNTEDQ